MCWWEVVGQTEDLHAMTWEHFTKLFREKYLGEARLARKVWEFLSIRQGKMSVEEYVAKFDGLARFARTIVPTDDTRKMKFMHGLRLEVAKQIDNSREGPESYADAVQRSLCYDGCDRPEDKSVETRIACQGERKERKENYRRGGQSSFRSRNIYSGSRPSFKGQGYGYSEPRPRYENMSKKRSKRRPDGLDNWSAKGRYTPREEVQRDKAALVPQCPRCHKTHPG